ncbi:unnamed protein product [Phytophthora lilii]|uniref:Unnamed protein product n=1 Tax=Phytophthora lilii TaxID=2077276 RepID=A0A9W6XBL8_9STRA|nr:unnamed protein product [Phytophthora lilii]
MVLKYTDIPSLNEEFEEIGEQEYSEWSKFRSRKELRIDLCPAEVEAIQGMNFSQTARLEPVPGLFAHADGTTTTCLQEDSKALFRHSATQSFFAFLPISLWKQVVVFSNEYAARSGGPSNTPIELDELMTFLGILW